MKEAEGMSSELNQGRILKARDYLKEGFSSLALWVASGEYIKWLDLKVPGNFRTDSTIVHEGGFLGFIQAHGGDLPNGAFNYIACEWALIAALSAISNGKVDKRALNIIRIISMGISVASIFAVELKPVADFIHFHVNTPDIPDIPAGVVGASIPPGVESMVDIIQERRSVIVPTENS